VAGVFDWARYVTGQTDDPEQALGQWSDEQQARNRAAIGMDANGNPLPTPAAPPAAGPNGANAAAPSPGAQAAAQAQAASTLPANQEPNATKTPISLGHLMMNLQQYNEREQGLDQALGAGFAAMSQPRDRDWVRGIFNVTPADPLKFGQAMMDTNSQQQGQDRTNALGQMLTSNDPRMQAQAQQIANSLNISVADLKARYLADPAGVGAMIQNYRQPTDQLKNLQQIQDLQNQLKGKGATAGDLSLLTPSLVAAVGPDFAQKAIGDAVSYRSTHGGKEAPWVGPGGVNVQAYNQWATDQKTISDNQSTAAGNLSSSLQTTDTLRQKLTDLQNNPGLSKILALPSDSLMKQAAWNAVNDPDPNWQKNAAYSILVNDPAALKAISELKEINGQEYTSAIHSLLGHGLRPSQTEVGAVREGFGQTKNINLFGNTQDYNAQAIAPLLTRLDEAQAEGYGSSGQLQNAPERLPPSSTRPIWPAAECVSTTAPRPSRGNARATSRCQEISQRRRKQKSLKSLATLLRFVMDCEDRATTWTSDG
jgi:hypothetical protein